ncbi:hypothetical protein BT93_C2609 [Corymbia citriodora subsp. variegata]|nr:hypothetical protein BT93_C2609 [Corymbia citriodora subsp. variegata]
MATAALHHSLSISFLSFVVVLSSVLLSCLCSSHDDAHHTIQVSSLLPESSCKSSLTPQRVDDKRSSLRVVHKHGPCSQLARDKANAPTHEQILLRDQSRVKSIQSRLSEITSTGTSETTRLRDTKANLPVQSGSTVGAGNYIVTVGLGTPKKDLSLIFDTGSDLTWTQCEPCVKYCYKQKEPTFNPSLSASYTNISCSSSLCSALTSATGNTPGCSASTCVYGIQYGDSSYSVGFFGKEKLTLTSTEVIDNFLFGCGQNNQGLFGGAAGLLGLGRDKLSLVQQTASKYGKYFSYCLPSSSSSSGHLTFGKGSGASSSVKFTPLATISQGDNFYGIKIEGISVGGTRLSISSSIFSNAPGIIDSGTVITRLPPTAYSALSKAFKKLMTRYPTAPALSILDTCYDLSKYSSVTIPKVSFYFSGAANVDLDPSGILYAASASQVCLAFAGNGDDTDVLIYGNVQQQSFEVVYDVAGLKLGFGAKGCA